MYRRDRLSIATVSPVAAARELKIATIVRLENCILATFWKGLDAY